MIISGAVAIRPITSYWSNVKFCQDHFGFDLPGVRWSKRVKKFEAKFHAKKLYIGLMCREYAENELQRH